MRPTRSRPGASPLLPAERALLCRGKPAIEGGIHLAGIVNFIEPGLDQIVPMPFNERRQRPRIKPASRNTQSRGELLRRVEHAVRNRDGRFHALSITPVIPTFLAYESVDSRPMVFPSQSVYHMGIGQLTDVGFAQSSILSTQHSALRTQHSALTCCQLTAANCQLDGLSTQHSELSTYLLTADGCQLGYRLSATFLLMYHVLLSGLPCSEHHGNRQAF